MQLDTHKLLRGGNIIFVLSLSEVGQRMGAVLQVLHTARGLQKNLKPN